MIETKPEIKCDKVFSVSENKYQKNEGGLRTHGYAKAGRPKKPLVSLITVVFNGENFLEKAIQSVFSQNYDNLEYLVIDGGSTDGTLGIIKKYDDKLDYWITEPDTGIYDAWNKGLHFATGEWVSFLGADDLIMPNAFSEMLSFAEQSTDQLDFICGRVEMYDGKTLLRTIGRPWDWNRFKRYMCVAHTGALHRRSYFQSYGLFDTSFRISGDYELLLRSGKALKAGFVNSVVARMQVGGQSNGNSAVFDEALRVRLLHGVTTPFWGRLHAKWSEIKWHLRRHLVGI
ncbi:glycosyltransferase family 2 protein [Methylomonas methanica]|uniref:Glycosyl transferase family 2 n=1 Tax=Methylomonas methanica (strain DSM 25384 / MC09) TaxID=857087 RepID=F9ZWE9_METMM|nr:glycosyltransferase family 2 protein [Methylomonas methanica]AEF99618.1 glycosyl transferase family 2 [Methylomonas methanica MC09]